MEILDIFVRVFFVPGCMFFVIKLLPALKEDINECINLISNDGAKKVRRKRKTARILTRPQIRVRYSSSSPTKSF